MTPVESGHVILSGLVFGIVLWLVHDDERTKIGFRPAVVACAVAGLTVLAYGSIGIGVFALPFLGFSIAVLVATLLATLGLIRVKITRVTNTTTVFRDSRQEQPKLLQPEADSSISQSHETQERPVACAASGSRGSDHSRRVTAHVVDADESRRDSQRADRSCRSLRPAGLVGLDRKTETGVAIPQLLTTDSSEEADVPNEQRQHTTDGKHLSTQANRTVAHRLLRRVRKATDPFESND